MYLCKCHHVGRCFFFFHLRRRNRFSARLRRLRFFFTVAKDRSLSIHHRGISGQTRKREATCRVDFICSRRTPPFFSLSPFYAVMNNFRLTKYDRPRGVCLLRINPRKLHPTVRYAQRRFTAQTTGSLSLSLSLSV